MIDNKDRLKNDANELMREIALKVKETVACIVGVKNIDQSNNEFYKTYFNNLSAPPEVVAWIEMSPLNSTNNNSTNKRRRQSGFGAYQNKLKEKLCWMKASVLVCNKETSTLTNVEVQSTAY